MDIGWTLGGARFHNMLISRDFPAMSRGIEMLYKGMQPALNDLAGGHIAMMTSPIPLALPLAHGGKVRMLGVTTKERVGAIPDVPPLAEIGVPGYDAASWWM